MKKRDVTTFATHCRLKIQLFLYTYAHFIHTDDLCILSSCVCVCVPTKCPFVYKTPPHEHNSFPFRLALWCCTPCMHASEQWSPDFHMNLCRKKPHQIQKNKCYISFVINMLVVFFFFLLVYVHGLHGSLHTLLWFLLPFVVASASPSSLLLLWYIQRKDSEIKKKV